MHMPVPYIEFSKCARIHTEEGCGNAGNHSGGNPKVSLQSDDSGSVEKERARERARAKSAREGGQERARERESERERASESERERERACDHEACFTGVFVGNVSCICPHVCMHVHSTYRYT